MDLLRGDAAFLRYNPGKPLDGLEGSGCRAPGRQADLGGKVGGNLSAQVDVATCGNAGAAGVAGRMMPVLVRNEWVSRLAAKASKRDVAASRKRLIANEERWQLCSNGGFPLEPHLFIETSAMSPSEVA
jgi:hypothetical protein